VCRFSINRHCLGVCDTCKDYSNFTAPIYLAYKPRGSKAKWEHSWYYTTRLVLARDKNRCQECKKIVRDGYEIHHIRRREYGGTNHPSNLMLLCKECHKALNSRWTDEKFKEKKEKDKYEEYWKKLLFL